MAPIIYLILQVFLRLRLVFCQSGVSITLTAPINPVEAGNMLSIHCQVHQLKIGKHVVEMKRHVTGTSEERVSLDDKMMVDDMDERFFLAQRRLQNSMVYFLSIIEITRETDEGIYLCIIRDQETLAEITRKSVKVLFKYFPADIYPICYPSDYSGEITMTAGQQMAMNCTSELGNPDIEIEWTRNDVILENARESTEIGHSILDLTFTTSSEDNGAIYVCKITSIAFPEDHRSCHVGPFKILPDPKATKKPSAGIVETGNKVSFPGQTTVTPKIGQSSNKKNGPTYITTECSEVCDENILYWIIATIIAGTLAIVFCIIGIIIFVRYRRRRKEDKKKRENSRNSHYQNREAIYAEVDTRPPDGGGGAAGGPRGDPNDNKLYMALDKSSYISTIDTSRASAATTSTTVSPVTPEPPETEPLNSPPQQQQQQQQQQTVEDPYSTRSVTHTTFGL